MPTVKTNPEAIKRAERVLELYQEEAKWERGEDPEIAMWHLLVDLHHFAEVNKIGMAGMMATVAEHLRMYGL